MESGVPSNTFNFSHGDGSNDGYHLSTCRYIYWIHTAFSAIVIGLLYIQFPGLSLWLSLIITAFVGLVMGLINGFIVTRFNVHSIIVTLETLSLYRGLVFIVSGGRQIDRNDIPEHVVSFSQTSLFFQFQEFNFSNNRNYTFGNASFSFRL